MRRSGSIEDAIATVAPNPPGESCSKKAKRLEVEEGGKEGENGSSSKIPVQAQTSSGAAGRTGINPLENVVILNHLFKLCSEEIELLANCRLVCKQWYQESLLTWRTFAPIAISQDKDDNYRLVLSIFDVRFRTPLPDLLAYCKNPKNQCNTKPYRFVEIRFCEFAKNSEQFRELWDPLGSNLTTLHLSYCTFNTIEEFRNIIFTACPNLQTLNLDENHFLVSEGKNASTERLEYSEPRYGKHKHLKSFELHSYCYTWMSPLLPISWMELFSHFQSLTDFSVKYDESDSMLKGEFERLTDAIRAVRKHDPKALPIKGFKIKPAPDISQCDPVSQKRIEIIQELRLPLKSLLIKAKSGMDDNRVKTILEFHGKTVREIEVIGATASSVLVQPFPFGVQLGNLTSLKIKEKLCSNLAFLKDTPNLEVLEISGDETKWTRIISKRCKQEMVNVKLFHLEEFRLDCIVTDQGLFSLVEWMPNLTCLKMTLNNNKQFEIVCKNWKNLTSLSVQGVPVTEAGVTEKEDLGGGRFSAWRKKDSTTRPNLINLQRLEKFTFWTDRLTDAFVFYGFLQLPRLRRIKCYTSVSKK